MDGTIDKKYVDHPAPSAGLITILTLVLCALVVALPLILKIPPDEVPSFFIPVITAVVVLGLASICFYFWPLYMTYYTLDKRGITVKYGPWEHTYPWQDFSKAFWQKGMFTTRIGWPSVTPCVRLSDGVTFKRKSRQFGLYLTPNDPRAFIERVKLFAPELTEEMIL